MPPLPAFLLAASSTAVAVIGGSMLLANACTSSWLRCLVATGQLAFSWYIGHILVVVGVVFGFGLEGSKSLPTAMLIGAGLYVAAAIVSGQ